MGEQMNIAVISTVSVIFAVYFLVLIHHFWTRRLVEPILSRRPKLVLAYVSALFAYAQSKFIFRGINLDVFCGVFISFLSIFLLFYSCLLFARVALLLYDLNLNRDAEIMRKSKMLDPELIIAYAEENSKRGNRFFRYLNNWKRVKIFVASVSLLVIIPIIGIVFSSSNGAVYTNTEWCLRINPAASTLVLCIYISNLSVVPFLIWKLRKTNDALGLNDELRFTLYAMITCSILQIVNFAFRGELDDSLRSVVGFRGYQLVEDVLTSVFIFYQALYVPFKKSGGIYFKKEKAHLKKSLREVIEVDSEMSETSKDSLDDLIRDPDFCKVFQEFLVLELKCKYMLFWKDVEAFRERRVSATDIRNLYLLPESPFLIVLPQEHLDEILNFLNDSAKNLDNSQSLVRLKIFDQAQNEVLQSHLRAAYAKFRTTSSYSNWKRSESSMHSSDSEKKKVKFGIKLDHLTQSLLHKSGSPSSSTS